MAELKVGGYRNSGGDMEDIIINQAQPEPIEPVEPAEFEAPNNQEPIEPVEPVEPVAPLEPEAPELVQPENIQNRSSLSFSNPTDDEGTEVNDELLLSHLSEKLGKKISSFEELALPAQQVSPLDSDPYLKNLVEWREKTGRPIEDWIKYQKDYDNMPDTGVVSEMLQHKYPNLTEEELSIEMLKYTPEEYDDDREVAAKRLELKKAATEGRALLSQLKSNFAEPSPVRYSPEVQEDLKLAQQVKDHYKSEQENQKLYSENIKAISSKLNVFKIPLADGMVLDYRISEQSKKEIPSLIEVMPHWSNPDGTTNYEAVVTDAVKIQHFDDIIKVVYDQAYNSGKESIIKESNNINFNEPQPAGAHGNNKKGVVIEGLDTFMGDGGMKIRKRN